jgi:hypothetical protein
MGPDQKNGWSKGTMDSRYQAILTQARPRKVRLSKRGRSSLLLFGAVVLVAEIWIFVALYLRWSRLHGVTELWRNNGLAFYAAVALPVLLLSYAPVLRRQKLLLSDGQVTVAMITSRFRINNRGPFYVKYKFQDDRGGLIERDSVDSTNLLREGSSMLVYYDSDDVESQVAQCAAFYEIVVPGFKSDYVDE